MYPNVPSYVLVHTHTHTPLQAYNHTTGEFTDPPAHARKGGAHAVDKGKVSVGVGAQTPVCIQWNMLASAFTEHNMPH